MKLFAPEYYEKFKCIAEKCTHSCCVGWRIEVDVGTLERYKNLPSEARLSIENALAEDEDGVYIPFGDDGRCPHLTECGLCRIISTLGEDYTSEICREHPRFYHVASGRAEVGLGAVCEEAARIIVCSDGYSQMHCIGEEAELEEDTDFEAVLERETLYRMLSDGSVSYRERLDGILVRYGIDLLDDGAVLSVLSEMEYLDESHRALFSAYTSDLSTKSGCEDRLLRIFAYFVYRHASVAKSERDFKYRVHLARILERLAASLITVHGLGAAEALRIISEEIEYSTENTEALLLEIEFMEA